MVLMQKLWGYAVVALFAIGAMFGVYLNGRNTGRTKAEAEASKQREADAINRAAEAVKTAKQVNEVELTKVSTANETVNSVNVLPDGDAANRLRDKWSRD